MREECSVADFGPSAAEHVHGTYITVIGHNAKRVTGVCSVAI